MNSDQPLGHSEALVLILIQVPLRLLCVVLTSQLRCLRFMAS